MADPTRLAILEALRVRERVTAAELGRLMPHAKGSMRHHLKVLVRAGLIKAGPDGSWSESSGDALVIEASGHAEDPEQAVVLRLLDYIVTHRRIGRIERWERERRDGKWPGWAQEDLGRDYVAKLTLEELVALDRALDEVVVQHRLRAERRREQSGTQGEELVFVTLLGFPFELGE